MSDGVHEEAGVSKSVMVGDSYWGHMESVGSPMTPPSPPLSSAATVSSSSLWKLGYAGTLRFPAPAMILTLKLTGLWSP